MVAWNSAINTVRLAPINKTPYESRSVFPSQDGEPLILSKSTLQLYLVGFDVLFSGTEVSLFWTWWNNSLDRGTEKFTGHLDVINDSDATYQFMSTPQFNMLRAGDSATSLYRASFQLVQYSGGGGGFIPGIPKSSSDTIALGITQSGAVAIGALKSSSDTTALGITESGSAVGPLPKSSSDSVALGVTENGAVQIGVVFKSGSDSIALAVSESAAAVPVTLALGAPDLNNSIHANLAWFLGSHPIGATELGRELVSNSAMTLVGAAAFTGIHPTLSGWRCLTVPGITSDTAYSPRTVGITQASTVYSIWADVVINDVGSYSAIFSVPYANSGWLTPWASIEFARSVATSSALLRHTWGSGGSTALATGPANSFLTTGRHRIWITRNGGIAKFGVDSAQIGGDVTVPSGTLATNFGGNGNAVCLGNRSPYSVGEGLNALFLRVMFWTREVSVSEMAALDANPQLGLEMPAFTPKAGSDTVALATSESGSVQTGIVSSDTTALAMSESGVVQIGIVSKSSSDTIAIATSESGTVLTASIYYISPTGNDAANGLTQGTAWQTINKVNTYASTTHFRPDDQILFQGGQTFTGSLYFDNTSWTGATGTNHVTIGSYGTGRATISSGAARGLWIYNNAGVLVQDLNFLGNGTADVSGVEIDNIQPGSGKLLYVYLYNLDVTGYGRHGVYIGGGYGDAGNATGTSGFNDVTIDGVTAHGNCNVHALNVGTAGIRVQGFYGFNADPTHPTHTNVTVTNCKSYDNLGKAAATSWTGSGIVLGSVQFGTIEYCETYNNGSASTNPAGPTGIMVFDSDSIVIQYCEAHHTHSNSGTDGAGFDLDGGTTNSSVKYCYAHDNDGSGYMLFNYSGTPSFTWDNNEIGYCISQNDALTRTAEVEGSIRIESKGLTLTNLRVYNNTVFSSSATGNLIGIGNTVAGTMTGLIANNILYSSANAYLVNTYTRNPVNILFRGNNYYATGTFRIRWNNVTHSTFAAWRTASGEEHLASPATDYGFSVNPQLTNPGLGGTLGGLTSSPPVLPAYQLLVGSPMIDAGLNLQSLFSVNPGTIDFYRTTIPVGAIFDIGASEYVAVAGTPKSSSDTTAIAMSESGSAAAGAMGAMPAFGSAGSGVAGTSTSGTLSPVAPTTSANNLLIWVGLLRDNVSTDTMATPAGFTPFPGNPYGTRTTTNAYIRAHLFWKISPTGGETSLPAAYTLSPISTAVIGAYARVFRFTAANGFNVTNPIESINMIEGAVAVGASVSCPTVTPAGTNRLGVQIILYSNNDADPADGSGSTGGTWTQAVAEYETSTGGNATIHLCTVDLSAGTAISSGTVAWNPATAGGEAQSIAFALIPATV